MEDLDYLEENILEKLFGIDGEHSTSGKSDFDFFVAGPPGYVLIKLNGTNAELYFSNEWADYLEDTKELSTEDITNLKKKGYTWQ